MCVSLCILFKLSEIYVNYLNNAYYSEFLILNAYINCLISLNYTNHRQRN